MVLTLMTLTDRYAAARSGLSSIGQEHILHFYDRLDEAGKVRLLGQIDQVDWPEVSRLADAYVNRRPIFDLPDSLEPAPWWPCRPGDGQIQQYERARRSGEHLVRAGKVAAFTVAGGQGTRLGWDAPKGSFPGTPIRNLSLFGCLAEYILKTEAKFSVTVPWYVMTSLANDADTRDIFNRNQFFGLDRHQVMFFPQAMLPAFDIATGQALLEAPDCLSLSPNGHGGSLKALYTSGAIADMNARGVEQISYTQIDNPLVRVVDPLFIGLHAEAGAQMSSKMVPKAYPDERLGNFCLANGKVTVIEYSDLPGELANQRSADGQLRFRSGSTAIHMIRVDFVESLNQSPAGFVLPFHRAEKKVPFVELDSGQRVEPDDPNAVKLETFVFDALPLCSASIVYETDRTEEFAPIKNADADQAVDSPQTSKQLQVERAARWLESKGVRIPRRDDGQVEAVIEIRPSTAIEPDDLDKVALPDSIEAGSELLL